MKQKKFVYEFERCHWDAMRVYPNYDQESAERTEEQEPVDSFSSTSSFSKSVVFSRSMLDFSMSPAKSPRSYRKLPSERTLEIETSSKTMKGRLQSSHNLSSYASFKTRSSSKEKEKESSTPVSSVSDGGNACGFKSIAQSLRDQQYSLPVDELHFVNTGISPGPNYQGSSETGTADLMWNHKSVILCANGLKEACSLSKGAGTEEGPSSFALDEAVANRESSVRALQCAVNLASICTAMTGLFITADGALDTIQSHTQRTILELLDSSLKDDLDSDVVSEDDFLLKKNEICSLRLELFKTEMNRGLWNRLHSTSKNLFSMSFQTDRELTLTDQVKKINDEYKSLENVEEFQLDSITPLQTEFEEVLGLKDTISIFSQLLLDFIDSRSDSIFDDNLTKKLFLTWGGEESSELSDQDVSLRADISLRAESDENSMLDGDENNLTDSSTTANSVKSDFERKPDMEYPDKVLSAINTLFEKDKLER